MPVNTTLSQLNNLLTNNNDHPIMFSWGTLSRHDHKTIPNGATMTPLTKPQKQSEVLSLLCKANNRIDQIVRSEGRYPGVHNPPKIERNSLNHHVVALAGIIERTSAHSMHATVGNIVVIIKRRR